MYQWHSNFTNVERRSELRKGYLILLNFCSFQTFFVENEKKVHFSTFRFHNFWIKSKLEELWHVTFQDTLSYNYAKFKPNTLAFITQNACLKRPWFGDVRFRKKGQNIAFIHLNSIQIFILCLYKSQKINLRWQF